MNVCVIAIAVMKIRIIVMGNEVRKMKVRIIVAMRLI